MENKIYRVDWNKVKTLEDLIRVAKSVEFEITIEDLSKFSDISDLITEEE